MKQNSSLLKSAELINNFSLPRTERWQILQGVNIAFNLTFMSAVYHKHYHHGRTHWSWECHTMTKFRCIIVSLVSTKFILFSWPQLIYPLLLFYDHFICHLTINSSNDLSNFRWSWSPIHRTICLGLVNDSSYFSVHEIESNNGNHATWPVARLRW